MTQGKLLFANKTTSGASSGEASAPPSYEEATASTSFPCHLNLQGDPESFAKSTWDDKNIRAAFIQKVYAILTIQLAVTLAIVAVFTFCEPVKEYIQATPYWYWASYGVFIFTYLTIACCAGPRRQFPCNMILLIIFTLSFSNMTGMLASFYDTMSVLLCLGITAGVCLLVTIFAFQTKFDMTAKQGVLFVLTMVMLISGIVMACILPFYHLPWFDVVFSVLGAIVFTMYLIYDTQLLIGDKKKKLDPEDYIFATLNIYVDIIYIFSFFLPLFGSKER